MISLAGRNTVAALTLGLGLASCGDGVLGGLQNSRDVTAAAAAETWMADLIRDGYRVAGSPVAQQTERGPQRYQYLLRKEDDAWACYELASVMEPDRVTNWHCLPFAPVAE